MREIKVKFMESIERTQNVKSFRFTKPEDFKYEVGQFVQIVFDEKDRTNKLLNKMLSISCCPTDEYIEVTKKISESEFSKKLEGLSKGDEILIKGPMGTCTLSSLSDDVCFLVGGIGITPVYPMFRSVFEGRLDKKLTLVYGNWTKDDIAFGKELQEIAGRQKGIKIVNVLAQTEEEGMNTVRGMITKELIQNHVENYLQKDYFIFGPPKMVEIMKSLCEALNINQERIHTESFLGY